MESIDFEWDENKNQINQKKHGIPRERQLKTKQKLITVMQEVAFMKEEYDIENLNPRKNPYSKRLKKQVTINIDNDTIDFFKAQSEDSGIPYQTLINLYLSDCAKQKKKLQMSWE